MSVKMKKAEDNAQLIRLWQHDYSSLEYPPPKFMHRHKVGCCAIEVLRDCLPMGYLRNNARLLFEVNIPLRMEVLSRNLLQCWCPSHG